MAPSADPPFQAVSRQVVSDAVHAQLRRAILDGTIPAGASLPGERALAEQFGVNRQAVREAVKRLQQARLIDVAHGGSTRVLDWRTSAGLDLLPDLALTSDGPPDPEIIRAALQMRRCVGADVARLCAVREDPGLDRRLDALLGTAIAADRDGAELAALAERYAELWRVLVEGSGNIAYGLALNSLVAALERLPAIGVLAGEPEIRDHGAQQALIGAIADGDPDRAGAVAHELLGRMLARAGAL